jgi:PKD repeat protein
MKKITTLLLLLLAFTSTLFAQTKTYCDSLTADFSYSVSGTKVTFTIKTTGSIIGQEWVFGDGTSGKDLSPIHDYGKPGTFQPCVTIKLKNLRDPKNPCVRKVCKSVTIQDPCSSFNPKANIKVDSTGLAFFEADFDSAYTYYWDFGDNTNGTTRAGKHQYKPGSYKACVKVYNTKTKCYKYICFNLTVGNPCDKFNPSADVKVDTSGVATFEADKDSSYTYKWTFGDGTYSTDRTGKHQFKPGTYQVCVKITNTKTNCEKILCKTITVKGSSNPCSNFNPKFEYKIDTSGKATFWGNNTNTSYVYLWSYGDGTAGSGSQVTHTYKAGTYKFCVTIKDTANKCDKTICETITVKGRNTDSCKYFNPEFGFKVDGTVVVFEAKSGSNLTYEWTFGSFGSSKDRVVKVDFKKPGIYKACVTITDTKTGCKKTICKEVVIKTKNTSDPCKDFNPKVSFQMESGKVSFTADGGKGATFAWDFGDGSKGSKDRSPVHTYAKSGKYNVCVTVYDAKRKCKKTICFSIEVTVKSSNPCDKFNPEFKLSINGNKVVAEASNLSGVQYFWSWGDKQTDTGRVADHTFKVSGSYTICLTAYDVKNKCKKTVCKTISLKQKMIGLNNGDEVLMAYPNPADHNVYVVTTSESPAKIIVKDLKGNEILRHDATPDASKTIDLWIAELPKGIYFMTVEQDGKIETTKFMK